MPEVHNSALCNMPTKWFLSALAVLLVYATSVSDSGTQRCARCVLLTSVSSQLLASYAERREDCWCTCRWGCTIHPALAITMSACYRDTLLHQQTHSLTPLHPLE